MWHPVKISDSLLAGEHPPIGKDQTITYLALGYSPEDKVYDRNQLYDPSPMLQKMVGKALAINKALKVLQVEMVTAPSMRVRLGIELAEAWTNAISEKRVVYGPMVSFYAAKRWTFKRRPEPERPRSLKNELFYKRRNSKSLLHCELRASTFSLKSNLRAVMCISAFKNGMLNLDESIIGGG